MLVSRAAPPYLVVEWNPQLQGNPNVIWTYQSAAGVVARVSVCRVECVRVCPQRRLAPPIHLFAAVALVALHFN